MRTDTSWFCPDLRLSVRLTAGENRQRVLSPSLTKRISSQQGVPLSGFRAASGWVGECSQRRAQQDASIKRVIGTQAHVVLHSDPCNLLLSKWLSVYEHNLRPSRPDTTQSQQGLL